MGRGPNDSRLIPDVDNLGTCLVEGVSSAGGGIDWLTELPPVRFLLLIVTLEGMKEWFDVDPFRGDARGGV